MANDLPELTPSNESMPPIKSKLEVAQDHLQGLCDRVQELRRKIWNAENEIAKAGYRGQLIEVIRQINDTRLNYIADGINVFVSHTEGGCPIRVIRVKKSEFYE